MSGDVDTTPKAGGLLILAATPIGDHRDVSARVADELVRAEVIAAEDTRRLPRLCAALGVRPGARVVSLHDHNEAGRIAQLLGVLAGGGRVLVVSDAGTPTVCDPGYRLVAAAIAAGHRVTAVPGPSAVLTALAVSGLPTDRFCFEGFLPRRPGERARRLAGLAGEDRTMVFFEAPHRLSAVLQALVAAFGTQRRAAVCRELTKTHEEIRRGSLADLTAWADAPVRGEVTLVVAGADPVPADLEGALAAVRDLVAQGVRLKEACRQIASHTGRSSRELYHALAAGAPPEPADDRGGPQGDPPGPGDPTGARHP